jgi:hypothetical protein
MKMIDFVGYAPNTHGRLRNTAPYDLTADDIRISTKIDKGRRTHLSA